MPCEEEEEVVWFVAVERERVWVSGRKRRGGVKRERVCVERQHRDDFDT